MEFILLPKGKHNNITLDFVAGLFLDIVRVCALPYNCAVYVLLFVNK